MNTLRDKVEELSIRNEGGTYNNLKNYWTSFNHYVQWIKQNMNYQLTPASMAHISVDFLRRKIKYNLMNHILGFLSNIIILSQSFQELYNYIH